LKNRIKSYAVLMPIAGVVIGLDQWTKTLVRSNLGFGEFWSPWDWLSPYARIVHWYNTGVALGLFQDQNLLFAILVSIIAMIIFIYYPQLSEGDWFLRIALAMQFGGSIGNLIDRLTVGHVTDFFSVGSFPVFNVADASVTIGVGIMILGVWLQERKEKAQKIKTEEENSELS
jgi:signal peptidase II